MTVATLTTRCYNQDYEKQPFLVLYPIGDHNQGCLYQRVQVEENIHLKIVVIQLLQIKILKKYEILLISISLDGNMFLGSYLSRRYAKLMNRSRMGELPQPLSDGVVKRDIPIQSVPSKGHFTHETVDICPFRFKYCHWWKLRSWSKFASHYA